MIQANELRIGNWVKIGNAMTTVAHITGDEDYFNPIPLTPEILEKAGFEKVPHMIVSVWQIPMGRSRFLTVHDASGGNEMVFVSEEERPVVKNLIVVRNRDYDGQTYLHHIQNIFYCHTQTELNIKL